MATTYKICVTATSDTQEDHDAIVSKARQLSVETHTVTVDDDAKTVMVEYDANTD